METSACSGGLAVRFPPAPRKLLLWAFDTMSKYPHQPLSASKSRGQKGAGLRDADFLCVIVYGLLFVPFSPCASRHAVEAAWHPSGWPSGQPGGETRPALVSSNTLCSLPNLKVSLNPRASACAPNCGSPGAHTESHSQPLWSRCRDGVKGL